jgi:prepilin-type processing-associated H-X9-DG protein/prepilin-type N-terminal cleavage/methylation domain-containing protein
MGLVDIEYLVDSYLLGAAGDGEIARLEAAIRTDANARRFLVSSCKNVLNLRAAIMQNNAIDRRVSTIPILGRQPGNRFRRMAAFTLVELLVVIAILSIIAGMLLPVLGKARDAAIQISCTSNQKQLYLAYSLYDNEAGRQPAFRYEILGEPQPTQANSLPGHSLYWYTSSAGKGHWYGFGKLYEMEYLGGDGHIFYCPSQSNQYWASTFNGLPNTGFIGVLSYTGRKTDGAYKWRPSPTTQHILNNYWLRWCEYTNLYCEKDGLAPARMRARLSGNSSNRWLATDSYGDYAAGKQEFWMPHPSGLNVLFVDGHVKHVPTSLSEICDFSWTSSASVIPKLTDTYSDKP